MEGEHINWVRVGLSFLNFGVLVFILVRYGGSAIRNLLSRRHETIKKDLEEARALRQQAEERLRTYETRLAGIEREIADLIAGIRAGAEAEAARIVKAAEETAARLRHEAEFLLEQERKQLELDLKRDVANLAVELARKILQTKMTDLDQRRLLDQFVREMAGAAGAAVPPPPEPASKPTRQVLT